MKQYLDPVRHIRDNGYDSLDRTGEWKTNEQLAAEQALLDGEVA